MEALEQAGIELGLDPEDARLLTIQTALGAARMAIESDDAAGAPARAGHLPGRDHRARPDGVRRRLACGPWWAAPCGRTHDRAVEISRTLAEQP